MAMDNPFRNPERSLEIPRCPRCRYRLNIELPTGETGTCPRCGEILRSSTKKDQSNVTPEENVKKVNETGIKVGSRLADLIKEAGLELDATKGVPKDILDAGIITVTQMHDIKLEAKAIAEQFKLFNKKMSRYFKETKPDKKEALKEELVTVSKVIQEMILKLETLTQGHSEFKETYVRVKGLEQDLAKFLSILNLA